MAQERIVGLGVENPALADRPKIPSGIAAVVGRVRALVGRAVEAVHGFVNPRAARIKAFRATFGHDPFARPGRVELLSDGTFVVHGSLVLLPNDKALIPDLEVRGVLSLKKAPLVTKIPKKGVRAYAFEPNAATVGQRDRVAIIAPEPDQSAVVAEKSVAVNRVRAA